MRELKNEYDVVILAAGDFPTNETAIHILRTAKHLMRWSCRRTFENGN